MIGRIQGKLLEKQTQNVLVDVSGVAYEIEVPMSTHFMLPNVEEGVVLHTHLVVREDAQLLYGFYELRERSLFRVLIKINGVGPKMAISILSGMDANNLVICVHNNDVDALVKIPGVGKKTAERLIIELRDKLKDWEVEAGSSSSTEGGLKPANNIQDAEAALVSLGYKGQEANKAVSAALRLLESDEKKVDSESLIRLALKNMM